MTEKGRNRSFRCNGGNRPETVIGRGLTECPRQTMYETPKACAEAYGLTNTLSVFRKLRGETQSRRLGDIREVSKDEYISWARTNDGTLPHEQRHLPD